MIWSLVAGFYFVLLAFIFSLLGCVYFIVGLCITFVWVDCAMYTGLVLFWVDSTFPQLSARKQLNGSGPVIINNYFLRFGFIFLFRTSSLKQVISTSYNLTSRKFVKYVGNSRKINLFWEICRLKIGFPYKVSFFGLYVNTCAVEQPNISTCTGEFTSVHLYKPGSFVTLDLLSLIIGFEINVKLRRPL